MESATPIQCPHCGSENVRLSSQQTSRPGVRRYRCRKCKRHFEVASASSVPARSSSRRRSSQKSTPRRKAAIAVAASLVLGAIALIALAITWNSSGEGDSAASSQVAGPPPAAGRDAEGHYKRAFHFWTLGDYRESFSGFTQAANQDHKEARYYLALSHRDGRGTVQNYRRAFEHMQVAAQQGHLQAQYDLAAMYRDGRGVGSNREAAYAWWNIASSKGHEDSTLERDKLASLMSSDQIMAAQDLTMKELSALSVPNVAPATPVASAIAPTLP